MSARFALAVGRFYEDLADRLVAGAREELEAAGVSEIDVFEVPGAFELPLAAKYAAIMATSATMVHAIEGAPVSEVTLSPWWRRHLAAAFAFACVNDEIKANG